MNRREVIKSAGLVAGLSILPQLTFAQQKKSSATFRYCLNTSTIRGQKPGLVKYIEIAGQAGYDSLELWVPDIKQYQEQGNTLKSLKKILDDNKVTVDDAIAFAPWMVEDEQQRATAFAQMKTEMEMMAELGCKRIAAPPSGMKASDAPLDLFKIAERYKQLLDLGRQTGVMPQLEFWGASPVFFQLSQALMVAAATNDADARILPDIYHLFRGNSGFEGLKMLSSKVIEVIHINDYPSSVPREQQNDGHRVYPGDGAAPIKQIINDLAAMGGTKVLSLELFNQEYWKNDPLVVAKTGLEKMKKMVAMVS
jgi:2-keto-myo-inositol isomerase